MKAVAFQPPPPSSQVAVYTDPDDKNAVITRPVDYFVLFDSPRETTIIGFSIADGDLEEMDNFLGYSEDETHAKVQYPKQAE